MTMATKIQDLIQTMQNDIKCRDCNPHYQLNIIQYAEQCLRIALDHKKPENILTNSKQEIIRTLEELQKNEGLSLSQALLQVEDNLKHYLYQQLPQDDPELISLHFVTFDGYNSNSRYYEEQIIDALEPELHEWLKKLESQIA